MREEKCAAMRAKKWIERERSDEELVIIILTATGLCHRE